VLAGVKDIRALWTGASPQASLARGPDCTWIGIRPHDRLSGDLIGQVILNRQVLGSNANLAYDRLRVNHPRQPLANQPH